jgi:hypothetical protein
MSQIRIVLILAIAPFAGLAQGGATLVGTGYGVPYWVTVAPGQIVQLQVTGLTTVLLAPVRATGLPLPLELSGISATLTQDYWYKESVFPVPILAIEQASYCAEYPYPGNCRITLITVQVPTEVDPLLWYENEPNSWITISENGSRRQFQVQAAMANVHVVGCPLGPCVTHADGKR